MRRRGQEGSVEQPAKDEVVAGIPEQEQYLPYPEGIAGDVEDVDVSLDVIEKEHVVLQL